MKWLVAKWRNCCRISYLFGHQLCVLILLVQSDFGMRGLGLISMWLPLWGMRWKNRRQIHTIPVLHLYEWESSALFWKGNTQMQVLLWGCTEMSSFAAWRRWSGMQERTSRESLWINEAGAIVDRRSQLKGKCHKVIGDWTCVGGGSQPSATNSKHDHRSTVVKTQSQIVPVRIVRVGSKHYWLLRRTVLQQRGNFINNGLLYGRHLTTSLATTFHDAF